MTSNDRFLKSRKPGQAGVLAVVGVFWHISTFPANFCKWLIEDLNISLPLILSLVKLGFSSGHPGAEADAKTRLRPAVRATTACRQCKDKSPTHGQLTLFMSQNGSGGRFPTYQNKSLSIFIVYTTCCPVFLLTKTSAHYRSHTNTIPSVAVSSGHSANAYEAGRLAHHS